MGVYAQAQWTIKRLTLNLGLRFDYLNAEAPATTLPTAYSCRRASSTRYRVHSMVSWVTFLR